MSLAITHFALGAGAMVLLLARFAPRFRYRGTAVVASGLWALVPDLHYLLPGGLPPGLRFSPLWNVFWLHQALDAVESGRGSRSAAALALVALLLAVATTEGYAALRARRDSTDHAP